MPVVVPQGHVALALLQEEDRFFYLQIPLNIINSLCLRPRKYLLYLGWCVLGSEGTLRYGGNEIEADGTLYDQGVYEYVPNEALNLAHAVDIEVIKTRSNEASESEQTCDDFRAKLLHRDVRCVWTGVSMDYGAGVHIIPYARGSEWFRLIVLNRPTNGENVTTVDNINDIRNGIFANSILYCAFDLREVAVLKTPNPYLQMVDIPPRHNRKKLYADVSYPTDCRFTLQRLVALEKEIIHLVPNNADAAFMVNNKKPRPSDLLLHYNYGAAAVKRWGHGTEFLREHRGDNIPRPNSPVPAPIRPATYIHDRGSAASRNPGGADSENAGGAGGLVESEEWDEDDVMLFFWGNSKAATERHLEEVGENAQRIEQWRGGVDQDPV